MEIKLRTIAHAALWLVAAISLRVSAADVHYLYTDVANSVLATTDASGAIIASTQYKPYGQALLDKPLDGVGFADHQMDDESGLEYMNARYYDPIAGRFVSPDPVPAGGGKFLAINRYAYGNDNPTTFIDPTGMESCGVWACETYDSGYSDGGAGSGDSPSAHMHINQSIVIFVRQHLADAMEVAQQYGLTAEEVLGLAGLESGWGFSRFAMFNNYFGLHAPVSGETGEVLSNERSRQANGKVDYTRVATFSSFKAGLSAMLDRHTDLQNITDPKVFARQAQMGSGHWGWDPAMKGAPSAPRSSYQHNLVQVITEIQQLIGEGRK
ncbi:glucosaminidase domain-containing protein [Luteibacter flocculans]|uniref:Glucosaminidase domain-containing protein n=1 Tax=Luteibacter flocculans TaxID=2780091 RepID=A0ABY4T5J8_9GAMM|nr:RHS repeat-associated core domain-containing protein [Luteibacter flocculans]URL60176.1 glucosaminidase domain-containing protein [Luteibacter flocculans]